MRIITLAAALTTVARVTSAQTPDSALWGRIRGTLGASPAYETGSDRFNRPRSDLSICVADVTLAPLLAPVS